MVVSALDDDDAGSCQTPWGAAGRARNAPPLRSARRAPRASAHPPACIRYPCPRSSPHPPRCVRCHFSFHRQITFTGPRHRPPTLSIRPSKRIPSLTRYLSRSRVLILKLMRRFRSFRCMWKRIGAYSGLSIAKVWDAKELGLLTSFEKKVTCSSWMTTVFPRPSI